MKKGFWHWFWNRPKFFGKETYQELDARLKAEKDARPWRTLTVPVKLDGVPYVFECRVNLYDEDGIAIRLDDRLEMVVREKYIRFIPK